MYASQYPRHRTDRLVQSAFDGELLIQDTKRHRAHASACLGAGMYCTSATIPCCQDTYFGPLSCVCTVSGPMGCSGHHKCI